MFFFAIENNSTKMPGYKVQERLVVMITLTTTTHYSNHKKWCDDLFRMQNESLWPLPALPDLQVIEDW